MSDDRCRAAILISESGSNLQSFIDHVANGELQLDIVLVISNREDAYGLTRAQKAGIKTACIDHRNYGSREAFDREMADRLDLERPDLLVLAGFMRILSPWFVNHYAGRILNIHPALLPAYPGLDTHQRVLDAGEQWHGSTVHFVTAELDGGPAALQGQIPVRLDERVDELAARVQKIEHQIYPEAAAMFADGRLGFRDGFAWLDGKKLLQPVSRKFGH